MPSYKLTYFDTKGKGEVIRLLLTLAGQEFEDVRISHEKWPEVKPSTPQGMLPVLEVDGRVIPQSGAIIRDISRKFGFYGKNNEEATQIDVIAGTLQDFVDKLIKWFVEKDDSKKSELKNELLSTHIPRFQEQVESLLDENAEGGGCYLVGAQFSFVDIDVFNTFDLMVDSFKESVKFTPKVQKFLDAVREHEKLKGYFAKRPSA